MHGCIPELHQDADSAFNDTYAEILLASNWDKMSGQLTPPTLARGSLAES